NPLESVRRCSCKRLSGFFSSLEENRRQTFVLAGYRRDSQWKPRTDPHPEGCAPRSNLQEIVVLRRSLPVMTRGSFLGALFGTITVQRKLVTKKTGNPNRMVQRFLTPVV